MQYTRSGVQEITSPQQASMSLPQNLRLSFMQETSIATPPARWLSQDFSSHDRDSPRGVVDVNRRFSVKKKERERGKILARSTEGETNLQSSDVRTTRILEILGQGMRERGDPRDDGSHFGAHYSANYSEIETAREPVTGIARLVAIPDYIQLLERRGRSSNNCFHDAIPDRGMRSLDLA